MSRPPHSRDGLQTSGAVLCLQPGFCFGHEDFVMFSSIVIVASNILIHDGGSKIDS